MMRIEKLMVGLSAAAFFMAPAFAGQTFDSTTVGRDYTLNTGVGRTAPGQEWFVTQGQADKRAQLGSMTDGKAGRYMVTSGFSRRPIYNANVNISLPHIR